jgi:uncharacterized membrane protein
MIPFILVITLQNMNRLFCVFFYFHGSIWSQIDLGFLEDQYSTKTDDMEL